MSNQEKTSKLREIKESVSGVVDILRQIRTPDALEAFNKVMSTSFAIKEIFDAFKSPEMMKSIENVRLISENFNDASTKMQNMIRHLKETGIINESVMLVRSIKGTMEFVDDAGKDFREVSSSIKEIFHSVKTAQDKIQTVRERYCKANPNDDIADEMVITPDEVEYYLRLGWKYLAVLPNNKVVVQRCLRNDAT